MHAFASSSSDAAVPLLEQPFSSKPADASSDAPLAQLHSDAVSVVAFTATPILPTATAAPHVTGGTGSEPQARCGHAGPTGAQADAHDARPPPSSTPGQFSLASAAAASAHGWGFMHLSQHIATRSSGRSANRGGPANSFRFLNHFVSLRGLVLRVIETILLIGALLAILQVAHPPQGGLGLTNLSFFDNPSLRDLGSLGAGVFLIGAILVCLQAFAMYQRELTSVTTMAVRLLVAYACAGVAAFGLAQLLPGPTLSGAAFVAALGLSAILSFALRLAVPPLTRQLLPPVRVLVVGRDQLGQRIIDILQRTDPHEGITLHGAYDPVTHSFTGVGSTEPRSTELADIVEGEGIGEIVVASGDQRGLPLAALLQFKMDGIKVTDSVTFLEREKRYLAVDAMRPSWLLFGNGFGHGPFRAVAKRLFDIAVSLTLLLLLSPLLLLAMAAVYLESGRPIFFRQDRVGEKNRIFKVLKLRSMVVNAESNGPQWASKNDCRITPVGKFLRLTRIDELPQLFSVLRGDMSFVGPRPEREYFVRQLREQIPYYDLRHTIKPGLSGWAQVSYPYGASIEDARAKLRYDLYYIKNHSLLLDILVLLATVRIVVFGSGAR